MHCQIHTELKMIVTLVLGSRTSPATISLGLTTLGAITEIEHRGEERRGKGRQAECEDLKVKVCRRGEEWSLPLMQI